MNIVICDDEKISLNSLKKKIEQWALSNDCFGKIKIHTFTSSEDVIESFENGLPIDALFIDIQFPSENTGLVIAKRLHEINEYIPIVFVTSYSEYAMEGYKVNALRYLHKPVTEQMIDECMNVIWKQWLLKKGNHLTIETPTQFLSLPLEQIIFIEILGHHCTLHTADELGKYTTRKPLYTFEGKLPTSLFVKCHRSYIVNLMYVRQLVKNELHMSNGVIIPLGNKYKDDFIKNLRNYYMEDF